jgi:hypothetical protein
MSPLTLFLGKFFGLFCLLLCLAMVARPKSALAAIQSIMGSPGLLLLTGVTTSAAGVAAVLGHNVWSEGPLSLAVTLLGWMTLVKGVALMAVPPSVLRALYSTLQYPQRFRLIMGAAMAWSELRKSA